MDAPVYGAKDAMTPCHDVEPRHREAAQPPRQSREGSPWQHRMPGAAVPVAGNADRTRCEQDTGSNPQTRATRFLSAPAENFGFSA